MPSASTLRDTGSTVSDTSVEISPAAPAPLGGTAQPRRKSVQDIFANTQIRHENVIAMVWHGSC
jgi:hypothetical protein